MSWVTTSKEKTLHIVLKYREHFTSVLGTIALHEQIIQSHGCVWIGKWGRPIQSRLIKIVAEQIKARIPTYIFLAKYTGRTYLIHAGKLIDIATFLDNDELIPEYYRDKRSSIKTWFKIISLPQLDPTILGKLIGASSGMPINQTLKKSMASTFYVLCEKHTKIEDFYI